MSRCSKYQRSYWWPKVVKIQHGEYCKGCGSLKNLELDKINNDDNHNITDNHPKDFQILCHSCNEIKNPRGPAVPKDIEMTSSEKTNKRVEKALMQWLMELLNKGETVSWDYFVSEGSFLFDVSPETIERRYYKKYFQSKSGPFTTYIGAFDKTYIKLKDHWNQES